jgi:pimeloyl-ACP methyl ester carboxylesterase
MVSMLSCGAAQSFARVSVLAVTLLAAGCAVQPDRHFADHAIEVNGDGDIVPVMEPPRAERDALPGGPAPKFAAPTKNYKDPIERLFGRAGESGKDVLIFVHGGLVSFKDSMERTNLLVQRYDEDAPRRLDNYYPIMINWDSDLGHSYGEHLFAVRQGEKWTGGTWGTVAALESPMYFGADLGRSVVRAPIDILYTAEHNVGAIPRIRNAVSRPAVNSRVLYDEIRKQQQPGMVSVGAPRTFNWKTPFRTVVNIVTFPFQMLFSPIIDGFGTPAWENMQRRTKNLDNLPEEFDVNGDPKKAAAVLKQPPEAVVTEFARQVSTFAQLHPKVRITLVAHSMGAFIVNDLVHRTPDVPYANIVYMAGADSMRNTRDSLVPYLQDHKDTQLYILTLHPQAEIEESHVLGLAPRGSLLVWIDDFLSSPLTYFDRTIGRWDNVIQGYPEFEPVRGQVHIKAFDQTSQIQAHGDFGGACFWQKEFWTPGDDGKDAWEDESYASNPNACVRGR